MLATAGTVRSAMRVKSGSEPPFAAAAGADTGRPGVAACWASPAPLSARPVMTRPATKPRPASSSAMRVNRRTGASGSDGDSTGRGAGEFGNTNRQHAVLEVGAHGGVVDRQGQLERPLKRPVAALQPVELLAGHGPLLAHAGERETAIARLDVDVSALDPGNLRREDVGVGGFVEV